MATLMPATIISELWNLGHFSNPSMPTGVKLEDIKKLTLASPEVRTAIRSFQEFNADALTMIYAKEKGHTRISIDGEVGPLTEQLFSLERCGCPDYDIQGAVEAATGNGSWVHSCNPQRPGVHEIKVWINKSRMPSFLSPIFEDVWQMVVTAYRDIGVDFVRVNSKSEANIDFGWPIPAGNGASTIGLAIVPGQAQSCRSQIWARFSTTYRPGDLLNQWARLIAHELGHNMRLQHTRGGIMNSFILGGVFTATAWRGDPSLPILTRYFGGEPIGRDSPEIPLPPGDNANFEASRAIFVYGDKQYTLQERIMA